MKARPRVLLMLFVVLLAACGSPTLPPAEIDSPTPTAPIKTLLIWEGAGEPCKTAIFSTAGMSFGECSSTLTPATTKSASDEQHLSELANVYASFSSSTNSGTLIFNGSGKLIPTDAEKRAIAEWANLMFEYAQAGQNDASLSVAFAWHRKGGPGGFCDDVAVYFTGLVIASDCKGFNAEAYLTASQLEQVFGWVDNLASIDYNDNDAPLASGMTMTLALTGSGQKQADDVTIHDIIAFAATLDSQLRSKASAGAAVGNAETALRDYLTALHTGDYARAAKLYGGDTDLLQTWNPDINNDLPALFQRACTQNGLQCLAPRAITYRASEVDSHQFWVEFNNKEGTLFKQGPCCGETSGIVVSMFPFSVEQTADIFTVMDLPPYVP